MIFNKLCAEKITSNSREGFKQIINRLVKVPVFDTTKIHVEAAVKYALNKGQDRDTYILTFAHMRPSYGNANWDDVDRGRGCSTG